MTGHMDAPILRLDMKRAPRLRGLEEAKSIWAGPARAKTRKPNIRNFLRRLMWRLTGKSS
jgi:hypothetical protein